MASLVNKILRMGRGGSSRSCTGSANQVTALEPEFEAMTDAELRGQTDEFRERLADGESLDDLLPEAFAAVREAARRTRANAASTCNSWAAPPSTSGTSPR